MWEQAKATECVVYLANRLDNPTKITVFKLLYLADKLHLSRYGRFITGDRYVAMKNGPVPSKTYDLVKDNGSTVGSTAFKVGQDGREIIPQREADLLEFSRSDLECMDEIIAANGRLTAGQLINIGHRDSAWIEATAGGAIFNETASPKSVEMPLESIVATLPNAEEVRLQLVDDGVLAPL